MGARYSTSGSDSDGEREIQPVQQAVEQAGFEGKRDHAIESRGDEQVSSQGLAGSRGIPFWPKARRRANSPR